MPRYVSKLALIFYAIGTSGCAFNSEFAPTQPSNLFSRATLEIQDIQFFKAANPDDLKACVKPLTRMCDKREFPVGDSFDALRFKISLQDRGTANRTQAVRDYALYLAGAQSKKSGYAYFTTVDSMDIGRCSSTPPSAFTTAQIDAYGNYSGVTTVSNSTVCTNLYTITVLAFNDYAPIKTGILSKRTESKSPPVLSYDLYYGIADQVEEFKRDRSLVQYRASRPIDAWKYYLPAGKTVQTAADKYQLPISPDLKLIIKSAAKSTEQSDMRSGLLIKGE